jgi:hypothetical protein
MSEKNSSSVTNTSSLDRVLGTTHNIQISSDDVDGSPLILNSKSDKFDDSLEQSVMVIRDGLKTAKPVTSGIILSDSDNSDNTDDTESSINERKPLLMSPRHTHYTNNILQPPPISRTSTVQQSTPTQYAMHSDINAYNQNEREQLFEHMRMMENELNMKHQVCEQLELNNESLRKKLKAQSEGLEGLKKDIMDKIILPDNKSYIENSMCMISFWRGLSGVLVIIKYLLLLLAVPTLTFAATSYPSYHLAFIAGVLSLSGVFCEKFSQFATENSKKRNQTMNKMLKVLGVKYQHIDTSYEEPRLSRMAYASTTQKVPQSYQRYVPQRYTSFDSSPQHNGPTHVVPHPVVVQVPQQPPQPQTRFQSIPQSQSPQYVTSQL